LSHIFDGRKKTKKKQKKLKTKINKKTSAKHIRIRLLPEGGCVNKNSKKKNNNNNNTKKDVCGHWGMGTRFRVQNTTVEPWFLVWFKHMVNHG